MRTPAWGKVQVTRLLSTCMGRLHPRFHDHTGIVLDYCRRRLPSLEPGDKIRILEIGSGSGGTSAVVMDALTAAATTADAAAAAAAGSAAASSPVTAGGNGSGGGNGTAAPAPMTVSAAATDSDGSAAALQGLLERLEFVYTDISPQLVAYGRKTYGPQHPYAKFRVLDVERDIEAQARAAFCCTFCCSRLPSRLDRALSSACYLANLRCKPLTRFWMQGCEAGTTDIVFATNVLHATRNMGNTLSHSKASNALVLPAITCISNCAPQLRFTIACAERF